MSRFNVWIHFTEGGVDDVAPTLETWINNNKPLAEAYVAQRLSGQAWHKTKFIKRIWIEEISA